MARLAVALAAALSEADAASDGIAAEAEREAGIFARDAAPLLALLAQTRGLSQR